MIKSNSYVPLNKIQPIRTPEKGSPDSKKPQTLSKTVYNAQISLCAFREGEREGDV